MTDAIRIGTLSDSDAVMALMSEAFDPCYGEAWNQSQLAGMMIMPGTLLLVVGDGDGVDGFAVFSNVLDEAELLLLAVRPTCRRRGIGQKLLAYGTQILAERGVKAMFLEVREGNPAMRLYADAGFEQVGRRSHYYHGTDDRHYDALTMRRNIG